VDAEEVHQVAHAPRTELLVDGVLRSPVLEIFGLELGEVSRGYPLVKELKEGRLHRLYVRGFQGCVIRSLRLWRQVPSDGLCTILPHLVTCGVAQTDTANATDFADEGSAWSYPASLGGGTGTWTVSGTYSGTISMANLGIPIVVSYTFYPSGGSMISGSPGSGGQTTTTAKPTGTGTNTSSWYSTLLSYIPKVSISTVQWIGWLLILIGVLILAYFMTRKTKKHYVHRR
jgi:hypothetical protein